MKKLLFIVFIQLTFISYITAQESNNDDINVFTGGLFMSKGKWEAKFYNNLYTQIEPQFNTADRRSSFNTSFLQITVGSDHNLNYGFDFLYKSNIVNDAGSASPFKVFQFMDANVRNNIMGNEFDTQFSHGLTHFGPRLRTKPFKNKRFTFQQAVYIPTGNLEEGWIVNSDLFYEHVIKGKYMVFGNIGAWYPLSGDIFPYARVFAGTLLAKRFGPFVMLNLPYEVGAGTKFFITRKIELEFMYTYWLPIEAIVDNRMPTSINFGFRITNFNNF
ncbi:hypothetical protein JKA74_16135 [Marivirga sp. S37H4]|uniref:Uncharacterized protein n=1 Tax=Marivirga aurantiaca TaxID=2802615 RepID=A0A935CA59_9BACT|nr:hypothetical protein [Marivirga aurantiaca]MBK6266576.1 hypothetical protein [Marivirga aurantiaca]